MEQNLDFLDFLQSDDVNSGIQPEFQFVTQAIDRVLIQMLYLQLGLNPICSDGSFEFSCRQSFLLRFLEVCA